MNTQNINSNNIESKNGMSQVVIDLRPQVKHLDGHGREVLADVHFRIDVHDYTANLYTYTKEAREESEKACEAYYSEVVELLKAEGWTLRKEKFGVGDCPQMVKGTQYLYCHPQDISGQVAIADIETLETRIKAMKACKFYKTDNYGDIIVTTSESDEKQLYRDTYADGLASIWQEVTTTKRSNLYKDKAEAEHCVRRRICIANRRADLNDIGTGSYNMRSPLLQFLMEEYDRLLKAGYIKEATGQNGRTLCRWINKKEEKELNKARREAEKAEKERKAQERQERYNARCKELEAEALAQMPYKVGDTVKSRYGETGRVIEMHPEITGDIDSPHLIYEYDGKPTVNVVILDADGKRHCAHWSVYTLEPASEIKDVPAADLCWDEDEQGVKVWGNMEQHAENLTRMGAKRGRVVFKSNKTGLPTGADCWVLPKTKSEDVRQYVRKVHERIICDFSEAREKYGDKGHKYNEGEKVVTIYGRGTVVRGRAWYASDLIDVQLDTPTYNYIWSLVGTPQKMVAVSRNDIVSIELPEPPKEIIIEDATLQEASEIKPKATDRIESRKRTIIARAKQGKQAWRLVKGYEVRVRKAYTNDSSDPGNWTYCVSWYADGQLVECENGVRLEQAAKALNDLPRWAEARKAA